MATVGHLAMSCLGARLYHRRRPTLWQACAWSVPSFLPDADVVAFAFVAYSHPLGHRGAAHSLAAAALVGLVVGAVARAIGAVKADDGVRLGVLVACVTASHGLLDAMTDGGLGIGLLWPFTPTRYWAPWRPIPVAPIGAGMLSARGAYVLAWEALLFAPLFFLALRATAPRSRSERPGCG